MRPGFNRLWNPRGLRIVFVNRPYGGLTMATSQRPRNGAAKRAKTAKPASKSPKKGGHVSGPLGQGAYAEPGKDRPLTSPRT